ncbi:MAG: ferrous iron transport protein A [Synergistaceae bacterium]|jgi:ferrous iron transport protein A|nr:ferrous iron transport protein A [Synergistaceae bacterium]
MIPLTKTRIGEPMPIKKVGGGKELRKFLENLGFVPGDPVTVLTHIGGSVIVSLRESRVALNSMMASKIMV